MYQVGFGDCFLLSFGYASGEERHMLVDFGTTSRPSGAPSAVDVAKSIAERTNGSLDVLVISHRHRDHLSGLGAKTSAALIEKLAPKLIVLPWTEDPAAAADAGKPEQGLLAALAAGRRFAAGVENAAPRRGIGSRSELVTMAREELANADAVEWLAKAAAGADAEYLHAGVRSRIPEYIPGLKVECLGPPTPSQWSAVRDQRAEDPEYWMLGDRMLEHYYAADPSQRLYGSLEAELPLPTHYRREDPPPGPDRWIVARLRRQELASMTTIVRWLDDALNNTSLILLLEAAGKRLLFPGDAQIENWGWALAAMARRPTLRRRLAELDLVRSVTTGAGTAPPVRSTTCGGLAGRAAGPWSCSRPGQASTARRRRRPCRERRCCAP